MAEVTPKAPGLHVREAGEGPPVLLLHSAGLSGDQWRPVARGLEGGWRVVVPDLPGYGRSAPWAGPGGAAGHVEGELARLEALAAGLGAPVHLVGHSQGGFLALQLALRGAVPVASVAAYEPVAFGVLRSAGDAAGLADLEARGGGEGFLDLSEGYEAWLARFVGWWNGPGAWERLAPPVRAAFLASARKIHADVSAVAADETPHTAYAAIAAPTLLMHGEHTTVAARRVCAVLAEAVPRARLAVVPGAGHMGPLTHASAVCEALASHLRRAEGGGGA